MIRRVLGVLSLVLASVSAVGCTPSTCSFRNPEYSARVALCDKRIGDECARDASGRAVKTCPVLVECKAWAREECK